MTQLPRTLVFSALAALSLGLAPATALSQPSGQGEVEVGDSLKWLADQKVTTTTGKEFSFRTLLPTEEGNEKKEGSVFVLSFWAYKCPYSAAWDSELAAIAKDYAPKGVKVFGIDSSRFETADKAAIQAANEYIEENELPFPVLVDKNNKIADLFGAQTTPHIYVVDAKGNVVYTGAIDDDHKGQKSEEEREAYLRNALDALLAGKAIETSATRPVGCSIKRVKEPVKS